MKDNFLLKKAQREVFNNLSNEDAGLLIKGILEYVNTGDSKLDGYLKIIFIPIKNDIDKNEEQYAKICEKRKNAINKRWEKEKEDIQEDTNVYENIQENTNEYKCIQKGSDTHNHIHISSITNHNQENNKKDNRVIGKEEKEEETKVEVLDNNSKKYYEIVSYLNQVCGTSYRPTSKETQKHIKARLNDGFNVDDFKQVIDNMAYKWLKDEKMNRYLRPETLFGTKFESYLNEIPVVKPKGLKDISYADIDAMIEYEEKLENEEN